MEKRDYILQVTFEDTGKRLKPVMRRTEKGISNYANKMYCKYGECIRVDVGYFETKNGLEWVDVMTYHA